MNYEEVIKPLMSGERFQHCLNVAESAEKLAVKYGADKQKAKTAGILHDITKEFTLEKHMELVKKFEIKTDKFDRMAKKLWHAVTGSEYIKKVLKIKDENVINAVRYHTTARAGASTLEKVIFVADFISADRDYEGVEVMRSLAESAGLDEAVFWGVKFTIDELINKGKPVHPNTFEAYDEYAFKRRSEF